MILEQLQRHFGAKTAGTQKLCLMVRLMAAVSVLLLAGAGQTLAKDAHQRAQPAYRRGIVLLAFENGIDKSQQDAILAGVGAREIKRIGVGVHVVAVRQGRVPDVVQFLRARREVRFAEPDYLQTVSAGSLPSDTFVGNQWAAQNTGQTVNGSAGTAGADERSLAAWGITTGTNSVVVAVLDTGVQYSHPDLFTNMWNNPGGIGGCAAGTHGYNILTATCDPMDDDTSYGGHGTHVAGILGAVGNNAAGTAGVNWTTSIMALKWVSSSGSGATSDLIAAMDWVVKAKQRGVNVRVVNDSQTWVGTAFSQALSDEIDLLGTNDILFVTASGNTAQNNDVVPRYACSYARPTMICAAASDQNDHLWSSANYGPVSVQLAAPGVNIYSTLRTNNFGYISGGSMASPQVAGTAALILSLGYQSVGNLRSLILDNVDVLSSLSGLVSTGGRLNVCKAVPGCSAAVAGSLTSSAVPVVTSIPQQGGLLGASTGMWNGVPATYAYQWNRCDASGLNCSPIVGATGQTYALLAPADALATISVTVTASNAFGSSSAQSAASSGVASATSASTITSSIANGTTINGTVNWAVAPARSEQFVQFYLDGLLTQTSSNSPYVFTSGSLDTTTLSNGPHILGARALFTDNRTYDFYGESVTVSNPPQNTSLPSISGTLAPGNTISTTNGVWNAKSAPIGFSYQWEHCDSNGLNCATISGAMNSTYSLTGTDNGFTIRSSVTGSNSAGSVTAVSAQTGVVSGTSLQVTTTSLPSGTQNTAYSTTLTATGGNTPYSWSMASGTLPTGLTLASGTGVISGTPTGSGTSNFTVRVTDSNSLTATQTLSITVVSNSSPMITTTALPVAAQNASYNATLTATGGTLPYTWSISSGSLPRGLSLASSTGVISGSPSRTGTSSFTVQLRDANSVTATKSLSLTVVTPPTVSSMWLPISTQSASYSATLTASGGTLPYTWSITSGTLPAGLALASNTGVISGTPTSAGTSNFTVQMSDANSLSATKALSITITGSLTGGGIGLVQANAAQGSSATTLSVPFPTTNSSGNLILAFVRMSSSFQTVQVTDSLGNTYTDAVAQVQTNDSTQVHLFYAKNIPGGTNTVKATFSSSNSHSWLAIYEYAGLNPANPLDRTAHAQGSSNAPSTGATSTTSSANELVFAGFGLTTNYRGTQTPGSGFALAQADTGTSPAGNEATVVTATGSYTATYSLNSSSNWSAVVATFAGSGIAVTTTSLPNATQNAAYNSTLAATGGTSPYSWSISSGTLPAGLTLASGTGVISGTPTSPGTSNFTVQVSDANSVTGTKALSLIVIAPPAVTTTSLPGGTQNAPYSQTLAATGGTPPYSWSITSGSLPTGISLAPGTGAISGSPAASGASNFTVQVSDANSATAIQALTLNVAVPPTVTTTSLPSGTQNSAYSQTLAAAGGTLPYTWTISSGTLPAGLSLATGTGAISGAPTATGTTNFSVQVTDFNAATSTHALSLIVVTSPTVTTTSLPGSTQNTSYTATLAATGGTAPYTWSITSGALPAGLSLGSSTGVVSGTPTGTGTSNFTAQATDTNSQTGSKPLSLVVAGPPSVTTTSLAGATQNIAYGATLAATGGTLPYTWSIASGSLPAGLTIAPSSGAISGTPSGTGTSNFTVQVSDANSAIATQPLSVTVVAPPTVTTTSLPGGTQNSAYSSTLAATGGTPPYSWSTASGTLPAGLSLASGTGIISGTPTGSGTSNFTVRVTDAGSVSATQALSLTVLVPPTVNTTSLPSGTQSVAYSATLAVTGGTSPFSWSITSGTLPAGLSLAPSTGVISGTPTGTGTSNFTVQVTDANSLTGAKALSLTIASTPPPTITTTSLSGGTQNTAYSATLAAAGGTSPYTWSVTSGPLPAGLTLAPSTGVISGTPTGSGTSSFTVQVTDTNSLSGTKALSISVLAPPAVTTTSLPGGTQNTAYSATLAASGGISPYTWSVTSGTLPAGLTLAPSTGVISGTPTGSGTSSFTVQVTDTNSLTGTKALSMSVLAPPAVTTTSLPGGTQNTAYSATLAASGGISPYTWSVTSGTLPAGLTLAPSTGAISGTPTGSGTSSFTVQVTDANSLSGTKALSLTITASSGGGGIGLVQANAGQGSAVGSLSVPFQVSNTIGNLIVAFVRMSSSSQTVTLTDSAGNAYLQAVAQVQSSDGSQVQLFYAKNILGAANTVQATFSATNNHPWLAIYEYKGLSTATPLDQIAQAQGNSSAPNSGATPVTVSANELVFAGFGLPASYSGTQTAGLGYTLIQNDTGTSPGANESMLVTGTGLYAASYSLGSSANWSAVVATFKP